ncbi:M20 metallopeptidase family protein [Rothia kristinae]|uniref:M20 metallopeptidase family protein n=1 Tax=Rothia kristinae TaxID=37923 RepID=UPI0022E2537F|nr:M20 family metallopeptidase [Rothia kristinae]
MPHTTPATNPTDPTTDTSRPSPAFLPAAEAIGPELRAFRRELHRQPELGTHLPWTQQRVLEQLEDLPLKITTGRSLTSVTAVLRGQGRPAAASADTTTRPAVLLRGDMDGLPVLEESGEEFAATTGTMHACGHDLHTAGLVGAARILSAHRDALAGDVVFMFQPGEENPGGALPMIEEGVLDAAGPRVVAAYGFHVHPGQRGTFQYRPGTYMAAANILKITVHGAGGHGSQPHNARNPVPAAVEIAATLPAKIQQTFPATEPVVATITQLRAGSAAENVIGDEAFIGGSVRTMDRAGTQRFGRMVEELAQGIAAAHGCTVTVDFSELYPATICDPAEAAFAARSLRGLLGEDAVTQREHSRMGSEDFSYVLEQVPGAFLHVGASYPDEDPATSPTNHSARVRFDDAVLPVMAAGLAQLAHDRLAG